MAFRRVVASARSHPHRKATPKVLAEKECEKKDQYLVRYHDLRKDFNSLIYSVDSMTGGVRR